MPTPADAPRVIDLAGPDGLRLRLLDVGATWWSLQVPVPGQAQPREVLLGGATPEAHLANTAYLGATVGRVANRIAHASIERDGQQWALQAQPGSPHQLHGGPQGYDRRCWQLLWASTDAACFGLHSPAGDQGFPGALAVEVEVRLRGQGVIEQHLRARCTAPTPVCLTNHAYFNLDGRAGDVRTHHLQLAATHYAPVDAELIPTGELAAVDGSALDFRRPRAIGAVADGVLDHGLLLEPACAGLATPAAVLVSADGRLRLRLSTTMPALQIYTGQHLGGQPGRHGSVLQPFGGVALEPEWLPDSVHHPRWPQPSCWLQPGETWWHTIRLVFDSPETRTGGAGL